jgi:hypothetical protein
VILKCANTDAMPEKLDPARMAETKGDLARAHNDYASAAFYYLTALRTDRQNAVLYDKLGITELQLHDRGSARKYFAQALKCNPKYAAALNNLGAVAFLDKKYKPAVSYLRTPGAATSKEPLSIWAELKRVTTPICTRCMPTWSSLLCGRILVWLRSSSDRKSRVPGTLRFAPFRRGEARLFDSMFADCLCVAACRSFP